MDGFTYTNIFDTKGIEYLVIIAFLILIVPFWRLLNRPLKEKRPAMDMKEVLSFNKLLIPQGLLFHKNHTWAHLEKTGFARLGIDDLLLYLTGNVKVKSLPVPGKRITIGDDLVVIEQGDKHLKIKSPVSGRVEEINESLFRNSASLNDDPYGKAWLCKIKPENWKEVTNSAFLAENANEWFREEMSKIKDFLSQSNQIPGTENKLAILQEGGELMGNPLKELSEEVWLSFQKRFLDI